MHNPFSLYKKKFKKGLVWYARYWNEKANDYAIFRSTGVLDDEKKKREEEAEQKACEMLPEILLDMEAVDRPFVSYLEGFWKSDSPYVKECANIKKKPLSAYYVHLNAVNVRCHIKPYPLFNNITLRKLTAGMIKDWLAWIVETSLSERTINSVLSTMRVAVNYAVEREELDKSPFRKIKLPLKPRKKRECLLLPREQN